MHIFDYEPATATATAHAALDCWYREGGFLVRYPGRDGRGTLVVTDDLDDCQVMVPTSDGWTWVDDIAGHEGEIVAALRDVGASEPSISSTLDGAMSCADWLQDRFVHLAR